jgi:hypothetical protein
MVRFPLLNLDIAGSSLSFLGSNLSLCMVAGLEVTSGEELSSASDERGDVGISTLE